MGLSQLQSHPAETDLMAKGSSGIPEQTLYFVFSPCSWLLCPGRNRLCFVFVTCGTMIDAFLQCGYKLCFPQWEEMQELPLSASPGSRVQTPGPALSTLNISCMSLDLTGCSQHWRGHQSCWIWLCTEGLLFSLGQRCLGEVGWEV